MDINQLKDLATQNLSSSQIAKIIGESQSYVKYYLRKYKIKTKKLLNNKKIIDGIENKECRSCKVYKPLNEENFIKVKKGKCFHSYCRPCHSKRTIKSMLVYKQDFIAYKGGKCMICNYNKYAGALEFHHLDPQKKDFTIASSNMCLNEKMKKELDKCILVCSNCHREIHAGLINVVLLGFAPRTSEL